MTNEEAKQYTLKVMRIILEEQNGYTTEEIKKGKLDENCEGSDLFNRIECLFEKIKVRKSIRKSTSAAFR